WLNWAARHRGTDAYVGWFQATVHPDRTADVAWVVFVDVQRKGYAQEATAAVIAHLARSHRVEEIRASIDPKNTASIALAESLGMRRAPTEGKDLRYRLVVSDGRAAD